MSSRIVKLGSVITQRKGFITIDSSVEYKRCRVQVKRKGVVLRDVIKGILINTKKQQVCKEGDFLVAEIDAKVGGYGFVRKDLDGAIVSSHYFLFEVDESKMLKSYLAWLIKTDIIQEQINSKGSTNYAAIRPSNVLNFQIPLPSINEQIKLVERLNNVDEKYSNLQYELAFQQTYLQQLRQSILQEAVQGRLTQQNPTDEPATELLNRLKADKLNLIKAKKLKIEKEFSELAQLKLSFDLPEGWVTCRLGRICYLITDGTHHTPKYVNDGIPFISVKNLSQGILDFSNTKFISKEEHNELIKRCNPEFGDILLTKVGTTGIAKVIDDNRPFSIFVSVALLKFNKDLIYNQFLELLINSPLVKKQSAEGTEGIGNKNLVLRKIHSFLIPLPPLAEQQRIVAKVQQLMQMVNQLEQQVQQNQTQAQQLLQAVLKEAFSSKAKLYEENELVTMAAEK